MKLDSWSPSAASLWIHISEFWSRNWRLPMTWKRSASTQEPASEWSLWGFNINQSEIGWMSTLYSRPIYTCPYHDSAESAFTLFSLSINGLALLFLGQRRRLTCSSLQTKNLCSVLRLLSCPGISWADNVPVFCQLKIKEVLLLCSCESLFQIWNWCN